MKQIIVVTIGPGDPQLLTLQAADALRGAGTLILRTERHPVAGWLREQGIAFTSLDDMYDAYEDFDAMHAAMAQRLWKQAASGAVTFAVPDAANDGAVAALRNGCPKTARLTVLPGVSRADSCLAASPETAADGIRIVPAMRVRQTVPQPSVALLITELNSRVLAGDVKLKLTEVYDDEMTVIFYPSTAEAVRKPKPLPLCEIDRQKLYDHTVSVLVPAAPYLTRKHFCPDDLTEITAKLRSEDGCPWDRAQTHESLKPFLISEAWEAAAAIDEGDPDHLADELGDVLFQVALHAEIGRSHGTFTLNDVATDICAKMIRRHPHVFGGEEGQTRERWEQLKREERGLNTLEDVLRDVPEGLPSLMRAQKVSSKAARWLKREQTPEEALDALRKAVEVAAPGGEEEAGDLLLACADYLDARGQDAEVLLHDAVARRISRLLEKK